MTLDQTTALMMGVPMPLVLIGRDERVAAVNLPAAAIFGPATLGRHYIAVLRQPALLDVVETALKTGKDAAGQFLTREASRDITFRILAAPVKTHALDAVMLSLEDISHVQAAGQMRRDFVANVSHELRTPLTALLGFIETLRHSAKDDAEARERFLAIMEREAGRMARLIRDLLSLSRVESEERMRPKSPVDLAAILRSAAVTLEPTASEAGVAIHLSGAEDEIEVPGDADQLLQVFNNLIENAVKYGGKTVTLDVARQDRDPALRSPAVRVVVADDGEGIDAVHIPRLTERFYRVDNHRSREMGGTGLGLAIVKHIVNRHRGRLRVESEKGAGSRFTVVLPTASDGWARL